MRPFRPAAGLTALLVCAAAAAPASAEVNQVGDRGFVIRLTAQVPVDAEAVWQELIRPRDWWNPKTSFSGDAANLSLDPRPGGCFCETLPAAAVDDKPPPRGAAPRGGVEHMRVIYVERPRALRMLGALGPLQAEALTGTFTVQLKPANAGMGTVILWEYVVGGFMRPQAQQAANGADQLLGEQLARLAAKLGAAPSEPPPAPDAPVVEKRIGADFLDPAPTEGAASSPDDDVVPPQAAPATTSPMPPDDDGRQVIVGR